MLFQVCNVGWVNQSIKKNGNVSHHHILVVCFTFPSLFLVNNSKFF